MDVRPDINWGKIEFFRCKEFDGKKEGVKKIRK